MPEHGTIPFFIDDVCHIGPFAFKRVLSIAVIERSTNPSKTNRYPIVDILSFISVEMVFNLLSNATPARYFYQTTGQYKFSIILTILIKKSMQSIIGIKSKPYSYDKAS